MNREELACAAGFFNGEGCTFHDYRRGKRNCLHITVAQSSANGMPEELVRFQKAVGGIGRLEGPFFGRTLRKPAYKWQATKFEEVQATIAMVWPWLSRTKKTQASRSLCGFRETLTQRGTDGKFQRPAV